MHDILVTHPVEDPDLISFIRPELRAISEDLQKAKDCFEVMRNDSKARYLPQEVGEPDEAYASRLLRATYAPIYKDAIRGFAGLLGKYQATDLPQSMEDAVENVDMMGSSLSKFLNEIDQLVLRDGGAAVIVDMPQVQGFESALEEIEAGARPYLVPVSRQNVINWRARVVAGMELLEMAVIRTVGEVASEDGRYGTKLEPIYYHFTPGRFRKVRLVRGATDRNWVEEVVQEGETSLPVVPLVWFASSGSRFGTGDIPLAGLAELSIQHMQFRSDLAELIHKLSMPVPVRKGALTDMNGRPAPLTIGPNSAIDLPIDGDFSFAEPSGGSLAQHQQEIQHVEQLMDRSTLAFMYGSNANRTATEAVLKGSQIQAQIKTLIENKQSGFDMILNLWTKYTKEEISVEAGIQVSDNLLQRPIEANELQAYLSLFSENAISHQTLLEELQRGHALSREIDIEEELKRIDKERREAQEESIRLMRESIPEPEEMAPEPDSDDEDGANRQSVPVPSAGSRR